MKQLIHIFLFYYIFHRNLMLEEHSGDQSPITHRTGNTWGGQWYQHDFPISAHILYCASFFSPPSPDDDEDLSRRLVSIWWGSGGYQQRSLLLWWWFCDTCLSISSFPPPLQFLSYVNGDPFSLWLLYRIDELSRGLPFPSHGFYSLPFWVLRVIIPRDWMEVIVGMHSSHNGSQ